NIAALILEPVAANQGVVLPQEGFLAACRAVTKASGALLIYDEVITGFRLGLQGAVGLYQVIPDLICLGKIIGGGFPVAAVGGPAEILDWLSPLGAVYQAGTLSGNPVAMRAGYETLKLIQAPSFYNELQAKSDLFASCKMPLSRVGALLSPRINGAQYRSLFHHLFKERIYIPPSCYESWFLSAAHTEEDIETTIASINRFWCT
ncbi:MAG: hypothetical protein RL235_482, partial [Chlamydiota bacterium]